MPREQCVGDPMAMRSETISILSSGELAVPERVATVLGQGEPGQYFWHNTERNCYYSKYGFLNGFIYIPPLLVQDLVENGLYHSYSDVLYLNFYNIFLSLLSAIYLVLIIRKYTRSMLIAYLFVIGAFYCTFWWNYLRVQNSEIYQTLFLLAFYYHTAAFLRPLDPATVSPATKSEKNGLLIAGLFLGALIMVKEVYVLAIPIALAVTFGYEVARGRLLRSLHRPQDRRAPLVSLFWIGLPLGLCFAVLLCMNAYQFGSPFEAGYSQWQQRGQPVFSGSFLSGFCGFLFDIQFSIFLNFPILIFALPGFHAFWRKFPFDLALSSAIALALLLVQSKLLNWQGLWCYGPRYMLAVLPLLSLPFIMTLEYLIRRRRTWKALLGSVVVASALFYSCCLQFAVNTLPFFTVLDVREAFFTRGVPEIDAYFLNRPFGVIAQDLIAFKNGHAWFPVESVRKYRGPQEAASITSYIFKSTAPNYFLFPGEQNSPDAPASSSPAPPSPN